MRITRFFTLAALLCGSSLSLAQQEPPAGLIPPGLNPGDEFFIIFAGSDTLDGAQTSATYTSYAASVKQNDPDTDAVTGWVTLFGHDDSTLVTLSAFGGNTSQPVYNTNGDLVAPNAAGLFSDSLSSPIGFDESGNAYSGSVWTGFNFTGTPTGIGDDSLGGNDSLNDGCLAGSSTQTDTQWAASVLAGGAGCAGASLPLYVLSPLFAVPAPVVSITPGSVDFGAQDVGTTSGEETVTLSNSGNADLLISSLTVTAPFSIAGGTCGALPITVSIGGSCTLTFTYSPTEAGAASQTLALVSNAPSSPDSFTLSANGLIVPVPALNHYLQVLLALMLLALASLSLRGTLQRGW